MRFLRRSRLSYVVSRGQGQICGILHRMYEKQEAAELYHPFTGAVSRWERQPIRSSADGTLGCISHRFLNACGTELVSRIRIADEINRMATKAETGIQNHGSVPGLLSEQARMYTDGKFVSVSVSYIGKKNLLRKCFRRNGKTEGNIMINQK